jgi:hypothetical protein
MSNPNTNLQQVFNMTLSGKGPKVVPQMIDMRTASSVEVDLSPLIQNNNMDFISGFFFDNTENNEDLIVVSDGTNQRLVLPAGTQGYLPSLTPNNPKYIISAANIPGEIIPFYFYNIPLLPYIWPQGSGGGSGGNVNIEEVGGNPVTDAVPVSIADPLPVIITEPLDVAVVGDVNVSINAPTITDYSLTLSGSSEMVVDIGEAANYFIILNPVGNNPISVNLAGGDASVSGISLPAGGSIEICRGVANAVTVDGTGAEIVNCFAG